MISESSFAYQRHIKDKSLIFVTEKRQILEKIYPDKKVSTPKREELTTFKVLETMPRE